MKTWDQLTRHQQVVALGTAFGMLVAHVYEGIIEMTMSNRLNQLKLIKMLMQSRKKNSVLLLKDLIQSDKEIHAEFDKVALAACEGSMYEENGSVLMDKQ